MGTEPAGDRSQLRPTTIVRHTWSAPGARSCWLRVGAAATEATVYVNGRRVGAHLGAWTPFEFDVSEYVHRDAARPNIAEIHCADRLHTTNGFLPTLGLRWTGARDVEIRESPTLPRPPAAQRSAVRGTQLLVDGRPFRVRGILHWGYYPERGAPWPDDATIRREISQFRALGFNLIKFCLWIPPPRYLELCDELDMLVWQEYPVWAAPLDDPGIISEFEEFFAQDGPHACVILRTMTCENDHVDPQLGRRLIDLAHARIPGCVALDNSGWLCNERDGDFHDEHPYLHNAQWKYYARRMRGKLSKPLLLGETIVVDAEEEPDLTVALSVRRFQIETLAREMPEVGYVLNTARDIREAPLGIFGIHGESKYPPEQWAWHRDAPGAPREIPEPLGPIIGPRKGQWKCPEYTWWSPSVRVLDPSLPAKLIHAECCFDLLSGRVLANCDGTRVLVEVVNLHDKHRPRHPLIVEFLSEGRWLFASAFRHDTPAGQELWQHLLARVGKAPNPPEIGPLQGNSIVLEDWEMTQGASAPNPETVWTPIKCDTPLVNRGANVFEGAAWFRTRVDYPGGKQILRCEAVGDFYEVFIDGVSFGEFGPRHGTWDGTRDIPRNISVDLPAGSHELLIFARDWRGAGGMVGPVYFAADLSERIF